MASTANSHWLFTRKVKATRNLWLCTCSQLWELPVVGDFGFMPAGRGHTDSAWSLQFTSCYKTKGAISRKTDELGQ